MSIAIRLIFIGVLMFIVTACVSGKFTNPPLALYHNEAYGFEFRYPENFQLKTDFGSYYFFIDKWRAMATSPGRPIVSVIGYKIDRKAAKDNGHDYYGIEDRLNIGASDDKVSVAHCYDPYVSAAKEAEKVVINGITFRKFTYEDAGMMKQAKVTSYRTIHDGTCFTLELIESCYFCDLAKEKDSKSVKNSQRALQLLHDTLKTLHFIR